MSKTRVVFVLVLGLVFLVSCVKRDESTTSNDKTDQACCPSAVKEVRLITLDPGHFHAALVQKQMLDSISPIVHVYGPEGSDTQDHLNRIEGFITRAENPTLWEEVVYQGGDFFQKMLAEKPGNVVVLSGNNRKKTDYILASVDAGLNVFSDKPMCIDPQGFDKLRQAFAKAAEKKVLLYDIMTERFEITTALQRLLSQDKELFGDFRVGSADDPAVELESVHHFFKYVAGNPIKRPGWYFDTTQQGEGIVDVTTHLVDLVLWGCFPEQAVDYEKDVQVYQGRRWPTLITLEEYQKVTQLESFPDYLKSHLDDQGRLICYANGEIGFKVKGLHAKVRVLWNYQAPEGTKDTHSAVMKGTNATVSIFQGKDQQYRPELYVKAANSAAPAAFAAAMQNAFDRLVKQYPGLELKKEQDQWHIFVPDLYRIGHEAHFAQVTKKYLDYLRQGKLPDWEVPNMIAKYYINTSALELARQSDQTK